MHAEARSSSYLTRKLMKYGTIGRLTIRNQWFYAYEMFLRSLFVLIILFVFIQLWGITYQGQGAARIGGYTFPELIWYLIFAEAIMLSAPQLALKIEEEVKSGDVGYRLTRPLHYLLFHYVSYISEAFSRWIITLVVGSILGIAMFGWPSFGWGWLGATILTFGAFTLNYLLGMLIALCAFWVEETRGLEFVYQKFVFVIGGMMLPLEIMPDLLSKICSWLPFQGVVYLPSRMAVHFNWSEWLRFLGIQWLWIVLFAFVLAGVYRKGVKKLNVNGG